MKKIIAAAVAAAFVAPAFAADITITGDQEFSFTDTNGTVTSAIDGDFNVKASTETANGLAISADINITDDGGDDGSDSLTVSGPFGKIDMGDTSSAADKFDDRNDFGLVLGNATSAGDAAVGWDLPTMVPGLSTYISYSSEGSEDGGNVGEHTGFALQYGSGPVEVAYAQNNNEDGSKLTYVGGTASFGGLAVSIERMDEDGADVEEQSVSASYGMGDLTLAISQQETTTGDVVDSDVTAVHVHYSLGGGVTAFIENSSDDRDADEDATAVGLTIKF
jgi:hypothetical protein